MKKVVTDKSLILFTGVNFQSDFLGVNVDGQSYILATRALRPENEEEEATTEFILVSVLGYAKSESYTEDTLKQLVTEDKVELFVFDSFIERWEWLFGGMLVSDVNYNKYHRDNKKKRKWKIC